MTYQEKEIEYALQIIHHRNELDDLEVIEWLKSSEHKQLLEELALWGRACGDGIVGNVEEAKSVVAVKIKRRKLRLYVRLSVIAASVVVFFMVGILLLTRQETTITIAETEKGNYISLTLANGEVVNLDQQRGEVFRGNAGIIVNDSLKGLACGKIAELHRDSAIAWNVLKVPVGQTYHISLADGTQVWLNAATELQFPTRFCKEFRRVRLRGEAYFEVSKNVGRPFIVELDSNTNIEVLGTSFNIKAYEDDGKVEALLEKGKILMVANGRSVGLIPGELGIYERGGEISLYRPDRLEAYTAWRSGKFIFENASLYQVAKELARWYGLRVKYRGGKIADLKISGNLRRSSDLNTILKALEKTGKIQFEIDGQTLWILPGN